MPRLNPKHTRWCGGYIEKFSATQWDARINIRRELHRRRLPTLEAAKVWLESIRRGVELQLRPLTRAQMDDASLAYSLLPDGVTLVELARQYAEADDIIDEENRHPFDVCTAAFLKSRDAKCAASTAGRYKTTLKLAAAAFGGGDTPVASITHKQVETFVAAMSPSVRNATLRYMSAFFKWCADRQWITANPCRIVDRAKTAAPPLGILAPGEMRRLFAAAQANDPKLIPYLVVGAFAGVRPQETLRLTPAKIGAEYITLDASVTKTADARTVEIRPNLRKWLDAYPFAKMNPDIAASGKRIRRLCAAADIVWKHDCLRHSFATYAYELTRNATAVATEMGHQGTAVFFKHYRALAQPGQGAEWFDITP